MNQDDDNADVNMLIKLMNKIFSTHDSRYLRYKFNLYVKFVNISLRLIKLAMQEIFSLPSRKIVNFVWKNLCN